MRFSKLLHSIRMHQTGFTLVELTVALAVCSIIAVSATTSISQTFNISSRSSTPMNAITEVENAVHWLTRDAQMAQNYANDTTTAAFPLTLTWSNSFNTPGTSGSITYSIVNNKLQRVYTPGTGSSTTTVIAQHIDANPTNTNWSYSGHSFTFKITATISGRTQATETRSFNVVTQSVP